MDNYPEIDADRFPLSRKVLDYSDLHESLVQDSKGSSFSQSAWLELEQYVDPIQFERTGTFKEIVNWQQYLKMLSEFGSAATWEGTFKSITESGNTVYLELEERCGQPNGSLDVVNTCSVFRFNDAGKLVRLAIYMQSPNYTLATMQEDSGFRPMGAAK